MKRERNAKQAFIEGTVRVVARDGLDKTTTKTSLDKGTQRKTTENELPSLTQCTA